eukprot:scaffold434_cov186-Pinguiococcus_pyrenoidosus.AAC.77
MMRPVQSRIPQGAPAARASTSSATQLDPHQVELFYKLRTTDVCGVLGGELSMFHPHRDNSNSCGFPRIRDVFGALRASLPPSRASFAPLVFQLGSAAF